MKKISLSAQKRTVLGAKTKKLRRSGKIPANIYGKHIKSTAIELETDEFARVFAQSGTTGLVEISLDGEIRPVLVKHLQVHPVTSAPVHADFYQVDLKEKVTTVVPLEVVGASPAISGRLGVLLNFIHTIEVEALPTDLPEKIRVDISILKQVGDVIKVADLKLPAAVTIKTDPQVEIVKIGALVTKEAEAQAKAEAEAAAAASTAAAPAAPAPVSAEAQPAPAVKAEEKKPAA